jgi:hypothetical protein
MANTASLNATSRLVSRATDPGTVPRTRGLSPDPGTVPGLPGCLRRPVAWPSPSRSSLVTRRGPATRPLKTPV